MYKKYLIDVVFVFFIVLRVFCVINYFLCPTSTQQTKLLQKIKINRMVLFTYLYGTWTHRTLQCENLYCEKKHFLFAKLDHNTDNTFSALLAGGTWQILPSVPILDPGKREPISLSSSFSFRLSSFLWSALREAYQWSINANGGNISCCVPCHLW